MDTAERELKEARDALVAVQENPDGSTDPGDTDTDDTDTDDINTGDTNTGNTDIGDTDPDDTNMPGTSADSENKPDNTGVDNDRGQTSEHKAAKTGDSIPWEVPTTMFAVASAVIGCICIRKYRNR